MMDQFIIAFIPGGMSLDHSAWWLCERVLLRSGEYYDIPLKWLRRADYDD
jgi:hypothetical protein